MRTLMFALGLAMAAALAAPHGTAHALEPQEVREARVGETVLLKLPGNRDAGYRWYYDPERSAGADLVTVDEIAWNKYERGRSIFFSDPAVLTIAVRPKAVGQADLAFDYVRTWGRQAVVRTHVLRVRIGPAE